MISSQHRGGHLTCYIGLEFETNLANSQTKSETYGTGKPEKITVSKAPQQAIETKSTSLLEQNQRVYEGINDKGNAKLDLEPVHDISYNVPGYQ